MTPLICVVLVLFGLLAGVAIALATLTPRANHTSNIIPQTSPSVPASAPLLIPSTYAQRLSDRRFTETWLSLDENNEIYLAVQQLLAREILAAVAKSISPDLASKPGELAAAVASVGALLELSADLQDAIKDPTPWAPEFKPQRRRGAEG